jgi:tetratricopeptide (TPR) repeat protein
MIARISIAAAALIVGLHFLPFAMPEGRLWGFNHLLFLPSFYTVGYAVLAGLGLLSFITPLRTRLSSVIERWGEAYLASERRSVWLVVALAGAALFWFLRVPLPLLGDSATVINNVGSNLPVILKWTEIGSIKVASVLASLIPVQGIERGEIAYALLSVLSGTACLFFFFLIVRELVADTALRVLAFGICVTGGWMLLFFGYTENYPITWVSICAYLYFSLAYINGRGKLVFAVLFLVISVVLHLMTAVLGLSLLYLLVQRGAGARFYRRYRKAFLIALSIVCIGIGAVFVYRYNQSLTFRIHFLPLFVGRPATPYYAIFSPTHIVDIINLFLQAVPIIPFLAAAGIMGWIGNRKERDPLAGFLLAATAGFFLFLFMIDPKLGMGRDWDLFVICAFPTALLLLRLIRPYAKQLRSFIFPLLAVNLICTLPFLAVNLQKTPTIQYFTYLLDQDMPRSRPGLTILRTKYQAWGQQDKVDSINQVLVANFPMVTLGEYAYELAEKGEYNKALLIADSLYRADPYSLEPYSLRLAINMKRGNYADVQKDIDIISKLHKYDFRFMVNVARAYNVMNKHKEALEYLRAASKLNPKDFDLFVGLGMTYLALGSNDSAIVYGQKTLREKPESELGYYIIGYAYYLKGDARRARLALSKYLELAPQDRPERQVVEEMLKQIP